MMDFIAKWRLWIGAALLLFGWAAPFVSDSIVIPLVFFMFAVAIVGLLSSNPFELRPLRKGSVGDHVLFYATGASFVIAGIYHYGFDSSSNMNLVLIAMNAIILLPYPRVDLSEMEEA